MRARIVVLVATVAAVVFGTAAPALAKGADQATITGPGLARTIVVGGSGEPGQGTDLSTMAEESGLFEAMFSQDSGKLTATRPAGALGPEYALTYRVPGGTEPAMIRQDLYPGAAGGPLTFTPAGQKVFDTSPVTSGWYRAPADFGALLTRLGVPGVSQRADAVVTPVPTPTVAAAPVAADRPDHGAMPALAVTGVVALAALGGIAIWRRRHVRGSRPDRRSPA